MHFRMMMFMFKLVKDKLPAKVCIINSIHIYRTRQERQFHVLTSETNFLHKTVRRKGVCFQKFLDIKVDSACEAITYKFHLKHYLLVNEN